VVHPNIGHPPSIGIGCLIIRIMEITEDLQVSHTLSVCSSTNLLNIVRSQILFGILLIWKVTFSHLRSDLRSAAFKHFRSLYQDVGKEDTLTQLKVIKEVPHFFTDEDSDEVGKHVTCKGGGGNCRGGCPRTKFLGPDGWTQELFHHFIDLMGNDLLGEIEESNSLAELQGL
jgi:hypothetical protein